MEGWGRFPLSYEIGLIDQRHKVSIFIAILDQQLVRRLQCILMSDIPSPKTYDMATAEASVNGSNGKRQWWYARMKDPRVSGVAV